MPTFRLGLAQRIAALLLLSFLVQCLWIIRQEPMTAIDYRLARCGREMWELYRAINGYFTTCGSPQDGVLAYRAAGLPLSLYRMAAGLGTQASDWELRTVIGHLTYWVRLPFVFFGLWLGGALWWVTRRLFGDGGGYVALGFYCFSLPMLRASTLADADILAAWGLFGIVYTAIGVAHTLHAPPRKWRPRIGLLALAFGLTAAAHIAAALLGVALATVLLLYLAVGRRRAALEVLGVSLVLGFLVLLAAYGFHFQAFMDLVRGSGGRVWLSRTPYWNFAAEWRNLGTTLATLIAFAVYLSSKRTAYFGNTAPLLVAVLLFAVVTLAMPMRPWLWGMPFLYAFLGGVFADTFESRQRKTWYWIAGALLATNAALCIGSLGWLAANP